MGTNAVNGGGGTMTPTALEEEEDGVDFVARVLPFPLGSALRLAACFPCVSGPMVEDDGVGPSAVHESSSTSTLRRL